MSDHGTDIDCSSSSFSENESGNISPSEEETEISPSSRQLGVLPYQFEPNLSDEVNDSDSSHPSSEIESETDAENFAGLETDSLAGTTDWCTCGNCQAMDTDTESVCCWEIGKVAEEMKSNRGEGCSCVLLHPFFNRVCLDVLVLRTAFLDYRQQHGPHMDNEASNERNRYVAYRQFVRTCWGYLGRHIRVPLPSCAVNKIRATFPSEHYTGFKEAGQ